MPLEPIEWINTDISFSLLAKTFYSFFDDCFLSTQMDIKAIKKAILTNSESVAPGQCIVLNTNHISNIEHDEAKNHLGKWFILKSEKRS